MWRGDAEASAEGIAADMQRPRQGRRGRGQVPMRQIKKYDFTVSRRAGATVALAEVILKLPAQPLDVVPVPEAVPCHRLT